ncbi:HAD family acid phosphatase [Bradyrhizobium sp.]|uniref:HAD family acid phosphatase n=1 Tax=Bradyrhizobium sp. TaxID=376 RepID=UPI003D1314E0
MTRTDRYRKLLIATCAVAALSMTPNPAWTADTCPAPVPNHVPEPPPPPLNLGIIKNQLRDYQTKYYNDDVTAVFSSAQKYVEQNAAGSKRPALVLDIDETSLTNWPNLAADDFGFIADGSCDVLPAAVIFITGRPDKQRDATIVNLDHAGFDGWTELRTRPDRDDRTVQKYKMEERIKVEAEPEGYTIIANVGDQQSDIDGGHGGCTFKVPNPFYFIP